MLTRKHVDLTIMAGPRKRMTITKAASSVREIRTVPNTDLTDLPFILQVTGVVDCKPEHFRFLTSSNHTHTDAHTDTDTDI